MSKEIIEEQKMIAEFIGYRYIPHNNDENIKLPGWWQVDTPLNVLRIISPKWLPAGYFLCRNHNELRYRYSWEWLMTFVQKLESLGYNVMIGSTACTIIMTGSVISSTVYMNKQFRGDKQFATYTACLNLLKSLQ
jgi:hypothetical protein